MKRLAIHCGFGVATILLTALCDTNSAFAGETESKSLFAEGRGLRLKGNCIDAIPIFRKALETYPEGLGALRNIAECEEELKRYASARRSFWDLRLTVLKSGSTKYQSWDKQAEEAHAALDAKVARIVVRVKGDPAWVRINGTPMDPRLVGVPLEQDLGPIEVSFQDGSATPPVKKLVLEEGQRYEIELVSNLTVMDEKPPRSVEPSPNDIVEPGTISSKLQPKRSGSAEPNPTETPTSSGPGPALNIGGATLLAVGGAGVIGMSVAIGIRGAALSDIESVCPALDACAVGPTQRQSVLDAADRGQTASTLATVFGIVGGVGIAGGVGLLIAGASIDSPVEVTPAPSGAMLSWKGVF
jgi:hypothetical protein